MLCIHLIFFISGPEELVNAVFVRDASTAAIAAHGDKSATETVKDKEVSFFHCIKFWK